MAENRKDHLVEIKARASGGDMLAHAKDIKRGGTPDALLGTMMTMLANRGGVLLPAEEDQFVPLITSMAVKAEVAVRQALAQRLMELPKAPRGLYEFIAHDEISVAEPLLVECEGLDDDLLIQVVEEKAGAHASAVASRKSISPALSAAIIGGDEDDSILVLLDNVGAEMTAECFGEIVQSKGEKAEMQRALVGRDDLPAVIAHQIFWQAASSIRQAILDRFPIKEDEIDRLIEDAVEAGLTGCEAHNVREGAKQLMGSANIGVRLSVSEIINHAQAGRLDAFSSGVSARLGIRPSSIRRILSDQGGEALAVLCRALHADRTQFTSVLLKNDYKKYGMPRPSGQIEKLSKVYDRIRPEIAHATVQVWDAISPLAIA